MDQNKICAKVEVYGLSGRDIARFHLSYKQFTNMRVVLVSLRFAVRFDCHLAKSIISIKTCDKIDRVYIQYRVVINRERKVSSSHGAYLIQTSNQYDRLRLHRVSLRIKSITTE